MWRCGLVAKRYQRTNSWMAISHHITSHHMVLLRDVVGYPMAIRRICDGYPMAIRRLSDGSYNGFPTDSRRKLGSYPTAIRWLSTPDPATIFLKQLDLDGFLNNLGILAPLSGKRLRQCFYSIPPAPVDHDKSRETEVKLLSSSKRAVFFQLLLHQIGVG